MRIKVIQQRYCPPCVLCGTWQFVDKTPIELNRIILFKKLLSYPLWSTLYQSLGASDELYKSFAVISADRKYFSGASGIKISDNESPAPRLGDVEIGAVKHRPFQTIPQLVKRGEDGVKRPALVMRKQAGNVFKT